jgi:hypothetical protein
MTPGRCWDIIPIARLNRTNGSPLAFTKTTNFYAGGASSESLHSAMQSALLIYVEIRIAVLCRTIFDSQRLRRRRSAICYLLLFALMMKFPG